MTASLGMLRIPLGGSRAPLTREVWVLTLCMCKLGITQDLPWSPVTPVTKHLPLSSLKQLIGSLTV